MFGKKPQKTNYANYKYSMNGQGKGKEEKGRERKDIKSTPESKGHRSIQLKKCTKIQDWGSMNTTCYNSIRLVTDINLTLKDLARTPISFFSKFRLLVDKKCPKNNCKI